MTIVLWIGAAVLAVTFIITGGMKLVRTKEWLIGHGQPWAEDFSQGVVRMIGALEVLAAIGLILPPLLNIAPVLGPLAAAGLVLVMLGATVTHIRRKETRIAWGTFSLLALAAFVAIGGFVMPY